MNQQITDRGITKENFWAYCIGVFSGMKTMKRNYGSHVNEDEMNKTIKEIIWEELIRLAKSDKVVAEHMIAEGMTG